MTAYRLFDGAAGRPGSGPGTATASSGPFLAGITVMPAANLWFQGYWWWLSPAGGQSATAQKFALRALTSTTTGVLIPAATVTSGPLAPGWNYVPLAVPVPLSQGTPYVLTTGLSGPFPFTATQFGGGGPYAAGIVNGPLAAPSSQAIYTFPQGVFGTASSDPEAVMPATDFQQANFWIDGQFADTAPPAAQVRLWPNNPQPVGYSPDTANGFTLGTEFRLSAPASLDAIGFYSIPGTSQLPTECGIFSVSTGLLVPGTHVASPAWSGAAGSGWVYQSYGGVTLPPGSYKTAVANGAVSPVIWNAQVNAYWTTGPGSAGVAAGILSAPAEASAAAPGQSTYNAGGALTYPLTYSGLGSNYLTDVLVTPVSGSGALMAAGIL